jgi:AcrR family transcriptional regulator
MRDRGIREKIIDESTKLFLQKSYKGTSIKNITDAVNISKGALYWHFRSKNEVLGIVVKKYETEFVDEIIKAVNNFEGNFEKKFRYAHKFATEFAYQNRDLCVGFTAIAVELVGSNTEVETTIKSIYSRYHSFYKGLLELGKAEGNLRNDIDIDAAAHAIIGTHNGMMLEWYRNPGDETGKSFAKAYRDILLVGILKEKA